MAGHIATAEAWSGFSAEWEGMLPFAVLDKNNKYHFKMTEMAKSNERMSRVGAFYRIIEKYVNVSISCRVDPKDVAAAKNRIYVPGRELKWGIFDNMYLLAFRALIDTFTINRSMFVDRIPEDARVDFIFDNQAEKRIVLEAWDRYIEGRGETVRRLFGASPRFEDDKEFLPLQAADFWAWWVRKWANEGTANENLAKPHFDHWDRSVSHKAGRINIYLTEDQIVHAMIEGIRKNNPDIQIIYDVKFSFA